MSSKHLKGIRGFREILTNATGIENRKADGLPSN